MFARLSVGMFLLPQSPSARASHDRAPRSDGSRWTSLIGLALIAFGCLRLCAHALRWHPIGDYATESDFYSGYALGARALMAGHLDFARFGAYGPVYEMALALGGLFHRDLFTVARVVSLAAHAVTVISWWVVVRRCFGPIAAIGMVLLLSSNPTLTRYGYSATTDMLATAWFSCCVVLWTTSERPGHALASGLLAALAALTRYNLIMLLPAGLCILAMRRSTDPSARGQRVSRFLAGSALLLLPWTAVSLRAGHLPGEVLLRDLAFYRAAHPAATLEARYRGLGGAGTGDAVAPDPTSRNLSIATAALASLEHLKRDAIQLVGIPAAALIGLGLGFAVVTRRWRKYAMFVPVTALTFLPLATVFYTERYSMVLLPLYLLPAVGWIPDWWQRTPSRIIRGGVLVLLGVAVLVPTALWSQRYQMECWSDLPLEARAAGEAIRGQVRAGERLMARKGHVAYYAGLEPAAFPWVDDLQSLARYCEANRVRYLFFSRAEAGARPALAYLLDPRQRVPGLRVLFRTTTPPSVVYRIEPGFGR